MKKKARGSVGRAFRNRKRYKEDEVYKNKRKEYRKKYYKRPEIKKRRKEYGKKWREELKRFANKRCKKCNKLLHYDTKGDYCFKHRGLNKNGKK